MFTWYGFAISKTAVDFINNPHQKSAAEIQISAMDWTADPHMD